MPHRRIAVLGCLSLSCAFFFFACRWTPSSEILVQIKASEPSRTRAPASASDFDCYFINVTGDDVKSTFETPLTSIESCSSLGTVSSLLDLKSLRDGISLKIVAGSKRTVELWGVTGTTAAVCSGELDTLTRTRGTEIYKVSSTETDLFLNSSVELANDFDKETNHTNCALGDSTQATLIYSPLAAPNFYFGQDNSEVPDLSDWDVSGALPPPSALGNLSGPIPDSSFLGISQTASEQTERIDITYTLPSLNLNAYYGIRFVINAEGGTVPFDGISNCDNAAAIIGNGFRFAYWIGEQSDWTPHNLGPSTSPAAILNDLLRPPTPFPVQADDSSRSPFPAFHITVRSRDSGDNSTVCSALRINSVSADLVTLAR